MLCPPGCQLSRASGQRLALGLPTPANPAPAPGPPEESGIYPERRVLGALLLQRRSPRVEPGGRVRGGGGTVPSGGRSPAPAGGAGCSWAPAGRGAWGTGSGRRARLCRVFSSGDIGAESSPEVALLGRLGAQMLEASAVSRPRFLHAGAHGPKLPAQGPWSIVMTWSWNIVMTRILEHCVDKDHGAL